MVSAPRLDRITTGEAVTRFLRNTERAVLGHSLSAATATNYRRDLTEFVTLTGPDTILDDITATHLDDIMLTFAAQPDGRFKNPDPTRTRSAGTQARFRQSISKLFTDATMEGWIEHNPIGRMRVKPRQQPLTNLARKALPESAAHALLHTPDTTVRADMKLKLRDTFLLSLFMEVGPRVSEVCRANQSDVTVRDDGTTWLHLTGKGNKPRTVPLSEGTVHAYQQYRTQERPPVHPNHVDDATVALVLTWRGRRMTPRDIQLMVQRISKRLPPEVRRDVTPHGLRHTAATLLLTSGAADINTVKEVLGHASIATTGIYLDGIDHEMVAAVNAHPITGQRSKKSTSRNTESDDPPR